MQKNCFSVFGYSVVLDKHKIQVMFWSVTGHLNVPNTETDNIYSLWWQNSNMKLICEIQDSEVNEILFQSTYGSFQTKLKPNS